MTPNGKCLNFFLFFLDYLPNYETNKRQKILEKEDEVTIFAFIKCRHSCRVAFVIVDWQYSKELEETFEAACLQDFLRKPKWPHIQH